MACTRDTVGCREAIASLHLTDGISCDRVLGLFLLENWKSGLALDYDITCGDFIQRTRLHRFCEEEQALLFAALEGAGGGVQVVGYPF